jgi:hypothetical protein
MIRPILLTLAVVMLASTNLAEGAPQPAPAPAVALASTEPAFKSLLNSVPSPMPIPVLPSMPPPTAGSFVFYEDFENGIARWKMANGTNGVGWHHIKSKSCGGFYTVVLGKKENATFTKERAEAYLVVTKPIDLRKSKKPQLQYDLKGATMPPEILTVTVEGRRPGGAWRPIGAKANARYAVVVTFTADLKPYVGGLLDLRFKGVVKGGEKPVKGMFLDDIHVVESRS